MGNAEVWCGNPDAQRRRALHLGRTQLKDRDVDYFITRAEKICGKPDKEVVALEEKTEVIRAGIGVKRKWKEQAVEDGAVEEKTQEVEGNEVVDQGESPAKPNLP